MTARVPKWTQELRVKSAPSFAYRFLGHRILKDFMDYSRIAPRKPVLKSGIIDLGTGGTIACSVKNISETGALVEANTPLFIPERFKLIVETEDINRPCKIIWRKEK
jgi:hypothetical protein